MKIKIIYFFILSLIAVLFCPSFFVDNGDKSLSTVVRESTLYEDNKDYFDSFVTKEDDNLYTTIGKKKLSSSYLKEYETVSFDSNEYLITYETVYNIEDNIVTLNVYFDDTNEVIIENFYGIVMKNYNDEDDILFAIDDMHIFLSEIESLSEVEQCSL